MEVASGSPVEDIPELWTASAQKRGPNTEERAVLAGHSGWSGPSSQHAPGRFPPGFPAIEERGLIHQRVRAS